MAGTTGLEPATSAVTGQRSNQLSYVPRCACRSGYKVKVEASGGIRIDTIRAVAETGVDYISTSKIMQSAPAVDIGLDDGE